jgi:hypothetical protein
MNGNFLLPYGEVWAYSPITLTCTFCHFTSVVPVPPLLFPRLVLKVVTFYGNFRFSNPMTLHTTYVFEG